MFKIVKLRKLIVAERPVLETFLKSCFDNEKTQMESYLGLIENKKIKNML